MYANLCGNLKFYLLFRPNSILKAIEKIESIIVHRMKPIRQGAKIMELILHFIGLIVTPLPNLHADNFAFWVYFR